MALTIPVAEVLDRALKNAGIPIDGVRLGDLGDRSTWEAIYRPEATADQRAQGQQILATLDPQDATTLGTIKAEVSSARVTDDLLMAVVQALYEAIPTPALSLLQVRARILTLYRQRL